ncbi:hypothetical protein C348_04114 [Cryptococcus neoformans Gb118]|nr:hypothetical protein C350_03867 [Cryptococcus neoformans var. grubii MW-RSA36]OXL07829.1 hypothetical protein C348_04114 [Cryptococcus neoformans var. grubii Gb118]
MHLLILLLLFPLTLATSPATPSITFTSFPSPTPTPTPTPTLIQLEERCTSGGCGGPGDESTLTAAVVTSTILSTTSVPCYITTITTSSTTLTSTIYSTETITSTKTSKGTVYIIEYSPTPVVYSTPVESVVQFTVSWMSYWVESEGSYGGYTSQGAMTVYGGGSGSDGGCEACEAASKSVALNESDRPASSSAGNDGWSTDVSNRGNAWTHVNNAAVAGVATTKTPADGSRVAAITRMTTAGGSSGQGWVNWSAAKRKVDPSSGRTKMGWVVSVGMGLVGVRVVMGFL